MYHAIPGTILCLDYSQAHNLGTEYRSGTCISRPAAVLLFPIVLLHDFEPVGVRSRMRKLPLLVDARLVLRMG